MRPRVVELSVSMALDRKASHRELTSVLISDLYSKAIKPKDIQQGFDGLLNNLKDLTIDYPEAPKVGGVQRTFLAWLVLKKTSRYCHYPVVCVVMQKL